MINEQQPKNRGGRPVYEPRLTDRNIVELATAFGIPQERIANALCISDRTLRKHFKAEIAIGTAQIEMQLASNLFAMSNKKEMDGVALRATISLLQMRFGWSRYAPPPSPYREPAKVKKEQLDEAAQTSQKDTSWNDLLNVRRQVS